MSAHSKSSFSPKNLFPLNRRLLVPLNSLYRCSWPSITAKYGTVKKDTAAGGILHFQVIVSCEVHSSKLTSEFQENYEYDHVYDHSVNEVNSYKYTVHVCCKCIHTIDQWSWWWLYKQLILRSCTVPWIDLLAITASCNQQISIKTHGRMEHWHLWQFYLTRALRLRGPYLGAKKIVCPPPPAPIFWPAPKCWFFYWYFYDKTCCFQLPKLDNCCQFVFFDVFNHANYTPVLTCCVWYHCGPRTW